MSDWSEGGLEYTGETDDTLYPTGQNDTDYSIGYDETEAQRIQAEILRRLNTQDTARDVEGSSQADPAADPARQKANEDWLGTIARNLGISKESLLKGAGGAGLGYLLGERAKKQVAASKVPAGGIQSFAPYTPKARTAADYTGRVPAWVSQAGVGIAQPGMQPNPQPGVFPGAQPGGFPGAQPGPMKQATPLPYGGNAIPGIASNAVSDGMGPQRPSRPEDRSVLRDWLENYHRTKGGGAPMTGLGGMDVLTGGAGGYPQIPIGGWNYAAGGQTPTGLGYLRSHEDGMADRIPATIDGRQPAKLSGGEFVIPADVVSHLGNGNSDAGAKQLHDFMARIRKARTGNQAQGKRIDPAKFFPKGRG